MVICRPESVSAGMFWVDVQSDTTNHIVAQSSSFKTPFGHSFRIIVHHGTKNREKHYQLATGDTMEEIMRDWAFIQNIVNSKPSQETEAPVVADPTLALVSLVFTRWKQNNNPDTFVVSHPRSHSGSNDPLVIRRTDSISHPPSQAPSHNPAQLPHSHSDSALLLHNPHPSSLSSSTSHPPTESVNPPPPHSNGQSHAHAPTSHPDPPSLPSPNAASSAQHPASQNTSPANALASNLPSSHPHFPTTSVPTPAFAHLSTSSSPQKHASHMPGSTHHAHALEPTAHQDHAGECTLDAAVVAEVMAWEKRRTNLQTKMDTLNRTKTRHLEGIVNDYLEAVRGIVMAEPGLSDQIKMNMISQEYMRLETLKESVFSTKTSAIISCVDDEIKTTERAGKMKKSVIKLQSLTRGYLVRKKYKPQLKSRRQRNKCVAELVSTESTYVRLLELEVKVFLNPLRESSVSKYPVIRKEDVVTLSSNTESLLTMNKELLGSLEERLSTWGPTSLIGDILIQIAPYMKIYTQYVNSYNDALNTLNKYSKSPDFQEFISKTKTNPDLKSMDLASFLILPVQRIPRYVLLLQEIVRFTPATHPDYANLQRALELFQEVARGINERKRQAENTSKVMAIQASLIFGEKPLEDLVQPHRKFRKEGALTREVDSSIEDCYLFLFSDIVLITQKRKGFMEDHYHYIFKDTVNFASTTIRSIPDTRLWQHGFSLNSHSKNERFFAESAATKNDWMTTITESIEEVKKNRQTLKVEEIPVIPEQEEQQSNLPPSPTIAPIPHPSHAHSAQAAHASHSHSHSHTHSHAHTPLSHQNSRKSLILNNPAQSYTPTKLKQVVALYRQVLQLEGEIFVLPYQIKTLLPGIVVTPQNLQELQSRVTLLSSRVSEIDNAHDNVMCIIRDEKSVITLDRLISQGMVHIDSMLKYLTATFPKEMAPASRGSIRQSSNISNVTALSLPYQLMSSILSWYLSVSDNWAVIMEKQL